jgi:hypothetical protein
MTKLTQVEREAISGLINSIEVCHWMLESDIQEGMDAGERREYRGRWIRERARSRIMLADQYGIELPALDIDRQIIEEHNRKVSMERFGAR